MKKTILNIIRIPSGLFAISVLFILYSCAILAPFISPYNAQEQNLNSNFKKPSKIVVKNFKIYCVCEETQSSRNFVLQNEEQTEKKLVKINFFPKVKPYKMLGFINMNRKLFGLDSKNPGDKIHLLGTDSFGRDVFSRLLFGAQISLSIGIIGILINFVIGFFVGALSGYFGGKFDFISMRIVEFLMSIPSLYLLLAIRAALSSHFSSTQVYFMIIIILSLIGWAGTARTIRGITSSIRSQAFVMASESLGQSTFKILVKHILPNLTSYLIVSAMLSVPSYILGESALSFLGLGIQEPEASWGLMLRVAQEDMKVFVFNFWWMLTSGFCLFLTVVSFNILGNILRDINDPKLNKDK